VEIAEFPGNGGKDAKQSVNTTLSFRAFPQLRLLRGGQTGHDRRLGWADNLLGQRRNIHLLAGRKIRKYPSWKRRLEGDV
jgi:hypothetical protein